MSQSLFDYINDHLDQDGNLPQDFHLPVVEDENKVKFADGALDGISIYHMGYSPMSEDDAKKLIEYVEAHPEKTFLVKRVGLSKKTQLGAEKMAPLFAPLREKPNVYLPAEFK